MGTVKQRLAARIFLLLLLNGLVWQITWQAETLLPDGTEYRLLEGKNGFTVQELCDYSDQTGREIGAVHRGSGSLRQGGREEAVTLLYCQGDLETLCAGNILGNREFAPYSLISQALVSEKLAIKLFGASECLGEEVQIDGSFYEISGIYCESSPLLQLALDGQERVILPMEAAGADSVADTLLLVGSPAEQAKGAAVMQELGGGKLANYQKTDYRELKELLWQSWYLVWVIVSAYLLGAGVFCLYGSIRSMAALWDTQSASAWAKQIGCAFLCFLMIGIGIRGLLFDLTLPPIFSEPLQIFDPACYAQAILRFFQARNLSAAYSQWNCLSFYCVLLQAVLLIMIFFQVICVLISISRRTDNR